jgi:hypothetical protein
MMPKQIFGRQSLAVIKRRLMARSVYWVVLPFIGGTLMAASGESLKDLEVGSYEELAARPNPEHLVLQYIPSLAATLLNVENKKGSALTRNEVEMLRDKANIMAILPAAAKAVEDRRGYKDIDPANVWEDWQVLRVQFDHK